MELIELMSDWGSGWMFSIAFRWSCGTGLDGSLVLEESEMETVSISICLGLLCDMGSMVTGREGKGFSREYSCGCFIRIEWFVLLARLLGVCFDCITIAIRSMRSSMVVYASWEAIKDFLSSVSGYRAIIQLRGVIARTIDRVFGGGRFHGTRVVGRGFLRSAFLRGRTYQRTGSHGKHQGEKIGLQKGLKGFLENGSEYVGMIRLPIILVLKSSERRLEVGFFEEVKGKTKNGENIKKLVSRMREIVQNLALLYGRLRKTCIVS